MAAIGLSSLSCPYKIDRGHEQSNSVHKPWTFSISSQIEGHVRISEHLRMNRTMEFPSFMRNLPMTSLYLASRKHMFQFPLVPSNQIQAHLLHPTPLNATLNSPRGFGPPPKKKKKKSQTGYDDDDDDDGDDEEEEELEPDAGIIPEVVTNRMMNRMGFTVGVPLFVGLLFFPFFYYLKVVLKIDVPTWVPFIVSFIFFGTALLGVSYGIVSSSWDPMREGSHLGWNEAQKNWPIFWQSLRGGSRKK